ncbi:unnamed protein product [Notodromas monacha]|uniref:JmjC domain-containing protein n=1 Tax=Notodromas monacha TaxID=399045 RepID=A0A7R9BZB2_9CRUS|nr:unnamed protein product [Notodromas monacha]CAG0923594.1 unnamed protein product [Notodromas monacha]
MDALKRFKIGRVLAMSRKDASERAWVDGIFKLKCLVELIESLDPIGKGLITWAADGEDNTMWSTLPNKPIGRVFDQEMEKGKLCAALTDFLGSILGNLSTSFDPMLSIEGVSSPFFFIGTCNSSFPMHCEDMDLFSVNLHWGGYPKIWYSMGACEMPEYKNIVECAIGKDFPECGNLPRYKIYAFDEVWLDHYCLNACVTVQHPYEFIITTPKGPHGGFNTGLNLNVAINFAIPLWVDYSLRVKFCSCEGAQENNMRFLLEPLSGTTAVQPSMKNGCIMDFRSFLQTDRTCQQLKFTTSPTSNSFSVEVDKDVNHKWMLNGSTKQEVIKCRKLLILLQKRIKFLEGKVDDYLGVGKNSAKSVKTHHIRLLIDKVHKRQCSTGTSSDIQQEVLDEEEEDENVKELEASRFLLFQDDLERKTTTITELMEIPAFKKEEVQSVVAGQEVQGIGPSPVPSSWSPRLSNPNTPGTPATPMEIIGHSNVGDEKSKDEVELVELQRIWTVKVHQKKIVRKLKKALLQLPALQPAKIELLGLLLLISEKKGLILDTNC